MHRGPFIRLPFRRLTCAAILGAVVWPHPGSALPPPEQWLPDSTIAVASIPDTAAFLQRGSNSVPGRIVMHPALASFRASFNSPFASAAAAAPGGLEVTPTPWAGGQMTLALLRNGWAPGSNRSPAWVWMVDARDQAPRARKWLAQLRSALETNGVIVTSRQIRGQDFLEASVGWKEVALASTLGMAWVGTNPPAATAQWYAAQFDTCLLAGSDVGCLELVMDRMRGERTNCLVDVPRFRQAWEAWMSGQDAFAWIDLAPVIAAVQNWLEGLDAQPQPKSETPMPRRAQLFAITGLATMECAAAGLRDRAKGLDFTLELGLPAAPRRGVFKTLELDAAEVTPPPWVPASAYAYQRVRLDLRRALLALEQMLTEAFPQTPGVLRFLLQSAGSGGESVDLREELLASLGNDLVSMVEPGPTNGLPPITSYFLASTNAAQLQNTLQSLAVLLPSPLNEASPYTLDGVRLLRVPWPTATVSTQTLLLGAAGTGLFASTDPTRLQQLLHTNAMPGRSLATAPGFTNSVAALGTSVTGLLGFEDLQFSLRDTWEAWRQQTNLLLWLPSPVILSTNHLGTLIDATRLPPFAAISPMLGQAVSCLHSLTNGLRYVLRVCPPAPSPPPGPAVGTEPHTPAPTNAPPS